MKMLNCLSVEFALDLNKGQDDNDEFLYSRLPVVQAGTFALMVPTLAYFDLPQWQCPSNIVTFGKFLNLAQQTF